MNLSTATVIVAAFVGLSVIPATGQSKSEDEAKIEALNAALTTAVNAKDVDAIMKAYVPDESLVIFDIIPPRQYLGAKAFRKDWEDFLTLFKGPLKYEIRDLHLRPTAHSVTAIRSRRQRDRHEGPTGRLDLAGHRRLPQSWRQMVDCA
jgi:ketosteroid isomerase-like protein